MLCKGEARQGSKEEGDTVGSVAADCIVDWRERGWGQGDGLGGIPGVQMGEEEVLKAVAIGMEKK